MGYIQLNDIYLNIFRMLIGRSVPEADIGANSFMPRYDPEKNPVHILSRLVCLISSYPKLRVHRLEAYITLREELPMR